MALTSLRAYQHDPLLLEEAYAAALSYAQLRIEKLREDLDSEIQREEAALHLHQSRAQAATDELIEQTRKLLNKLQRQRSELERLELRTRSDYRQTLEERPWQQCPCSICQQIGIEVIIFRGNNRNRRRGFHNTWQLYQQLRTLSLKPEPLPLSSTQLELDL